MIRIFLLLGMLVMGAANAQQICSLNISELLSGVVSDERFDEQIPTDLMSIKSFIALKVCAPVRWKEYIEHMPSASKREAVVLVYAAQSLKGKSYLDFGKALLELGQSSKISDELIPLYVFPNFDWNTALVENYNDPKVISILKEAERIMVDRKSDVEDVLSGKRLETLISSRLNVRSPLNSF